MHLCFSVSSGQQQLASGTCGRSEQKVRTSSSSLTLSVCFWDICEVRGHRRAQVDSQTALRSVSVQWHEDADTHLLSLSLLARVKGHSNQSKTIHRWLITCRVCVPFSGAAVVWSSPHKQTGCSLVAVGIHDVGVIVFLWFANTDICIYLFCTETAETSLLFCCGINTLFLSAAVVIADAETVLFKIDTVLEKRWGRHQDLILEGKKR